MNKLLYIDVETTGLIKYMHAIVQIAYIIEIDGEVRKRGSYKIDPYTYNRKVKIEEEALRVNGFCQSDFPKFSDATKACEDFVAILARFVDPFDKNDKFKLVAFNADFDTGFIQEWFRTANKLDVYGYFIDYRHLDPFALVKYMNYLGYIDTGKSMNLEASCKAVGLEFDAHDAVGDIEATRDLHHRLIKMLEAK